MEAFSFWWLGIVVGVVTIIDLFVADRFPDPVREMKQEESTARNGDEGGYWKTKDTDKK